MMNKQVGLAKQAIVFLAVMMIAMAGCIPAAMAQEERIQTIMVYLTGSDLETNGGAATMDITEMLRARHDTKKTSVLVMIGGAKKWRSFPSDRTIIYEVAGSRPKEVYSCDLMNMGEADTLLTLLDYGYQHYPAESYSLILWDHGGGPLEGVCYDENFISDGWVDSLSMLELQAALEKSPFKENKLEWIGFDACLMSSAETAYICSPYAKYMIASQEVEPGCGWDYSFLKGIESGASGDQAGKLIVDSYYEAALKKSEHSPHLTLSCVDLSRMDEIRQSMDEAFAHLAMEMTDRSYSSLVKKRQAVSAVGRSENASSDYDLIDLLGLVESLEGDLEDGQRLQDVIDSSIVYARTNVEGLHGLSVYFPYYNQYFFEKAWKAGYESIALSKNYLAFLEKYSSIWLGKELTDWEKTKNTRLYVGEDDIAELSVELTDEQAMHLESAALYVLADQFENRYRFSSVSEETTLTGLTLTAKDPEKILVFCDGQGNAISGGVQYKIVDGLYVIDATLMQSGSIADMDPDETIEYVNIHCDPPDENGYMKIVNITERPMNGELLSGKKEYSLKDYGGLACLQRVREPLRDESGALLPFDKWTQRGVYSVEFDLQECSHTVRLRMIDRETSGEEYVYLYELIDTQGNRHLSELTRMDNEVVTALNLGEYEDHSIVDNHGLSAKLKRAEMVEGTVESGLRLWFELFNARDAAQGDAPYYTADDIAINGCVMPDARMAFDFDLEKGTPVSYMAAISAQEMAMYGIERIDEISFVLSGWDSETGETFHRKIRLTFTDENRWDVSSLCGGESILNRPDLCSVSDSLGMTFSLKEIEAQQSGGDLTLTVLAENHTEQDRSMMEYSVFIDGAYYLQAKSYSGTVGPGEKALIECSISDAYDPLELIFCTDGQREKIPDRFDAAGVNAFDTILFYHASGTQEKDGALLTLPEPFNYAAVRGYELEKPEAPAAKHDDYFTISIHNAEIWNETLYLDVYLENVMIEDGYNIVCTVNGREGNAGFDLLGSWMLFKGADTCASISIGLSPEEMNQSELEVSVSYESPWESISDQIAAFVIPINPGQGNQNIPVESILVREQR